MHSYTVNRCNNITLGARCQYKYMCMLVCQYRVCPLSVGCLLTCMPIPTGLVAKRMKVPRPSAAEAASVRDCIYEVLWSADSVAAAMQTLAGSGSSDSEHNAAFAVRRSGAPRSASATLSVLQRCGTAAARAITIAEPVDATFGSAMSHKPAGAAAMLRCATRELTEVTAASTSQSSSIPSSNHGGVQITLSEMTAAAEEGDTHGSSLTEGAVWRPRLARSTICRATGKSHC